MNEPDHSECILTVFAGTPEATTWWSPECGEVEVPGGWGFLPSGDHFVTRDVKSRGTYWIAKIKSGRYYAKPIGIWAPSQNIATAQELSRKTKEQREARQAASKLRREKQESEYEARFAKEIYTYLDFGPEHEKLAHDIAEGASKFAAEVGSGRVGRTTKLSLEEKAIRAAKAYIRHHHTEYEHELDDMGPMARDFYPAIRAEADQAVERFLSRHRKRR